MDAGRESADSSAAGEFPSLAATRRADEGIVASRDPPLDLARALTGLSSAICDLHVLRGRWSHDPELGQELGRVADRIEALTRDVLRAASRPDPRGTTEPGTSGPGRAGDEARPSQTSRAGAVRRRVR
jgi:hypothetical protein